MSFSRHLIANRLLRSISVTAALLSASHDGFGEPQNANSICVSRQELTARSAGIVATIHRKSGDKVSTGEILVTLDNRLLLAGLKEGAAAVEIAKANEELAADAFRRIEKSSSEAVSAQQKVEARLRFAQAKGTTAQAEAAYERLRIQVADTEIRAEIDGVARGLPQVKGLFVQFGQTLGYVDGGTCPNGATP
jgi:multidrug efflux pump subunit AcrA (membrane-fusion protein)